MISDAPDSGGFPVTVLNSYLRELYVADWEDPNGTIRLRADLTLAELGKGTLFLDLRALLATLDEEKGAPATAAGNLNRAFVERMFDKLQMGEERRELIRSSCKVFNEDNVWSLHVARVVAELGGLVMKRKKRFIVTKRGRNLLPDDRSGALYRQTFLTFFRKLNLHYIAGAREIPEIQPTMAITLWRIASVLRDWRPVEGLAKQILPPRMRVRIQVAMKSPYEREEWILCGYVLTPLVRFGLLEKARGTGFSDLVSDRDQVRLTPLFDQFIRFAPLSLGDGAVVLAM